MHTLPLLISRCIKLLSFLPYHNTHCNWTCFRVSYKYVHHCIVTPWRQILCLTHSAYSHCHCGLNTIWFFFLAALLSMGGLSFPTKDRTHAPLHWKLWVLTTGPPGKSPKHLSHLSGFCLCCRRLGTCGLCFLNAYYFWVLLGSINERYKEGKRYSFLGAARVGPGAA